MSSHKLHQHDYGLIDGYFHKNLEIHVSNILSVKTKHLPLAQTKIFILATSSQKLLQHDYRLIDGYFHRNLQIHISNILSVKTKHLAFKQRFSYFNDAITQGASIWLYDYRLIDGCFHKNLEIHVSSDFSNRQEKLVFKETETSLLWRFNYAINISVIIGSMIAASTKTLQFISATVYQVNRRN